MEFWEKPITLDELYHSGQKHRSGVLPEGSGENPYQHCRDIRSRYKLLKKQNPELTQTQIARLMGCSTDELRKQISAAKAQETQLKIARANSLRHQGGDKGAGATEIARIMSEEFGERITESTVREWLKVDRVRKQARASATVQLLKDRVGEIGMVDVSKSAGLALDISDTRLQTAITQLQDEGYHLHTINLKQVTNDNQRTPMRILTAPDSNVSNSDIYANIDKVGSLQDYTSDDMGETFRPKFQYPSSMDSSRLHVRYADESDGHGATGIDRDGLIEIRPGVKDLSLGDAQYAQVRILVDGTHYIKGMAVYSNNIPDGVDVVFNTNKPAGTPVTDPDKNAPQVLKPIKKEDPLNPFNSALRTKNGEIGQSMYTDDDGTQKLSLINKTREEGDWNDWAKKVPSQFLSKQDRTLIRRQLDETVSDYQEQFNEIMSISQPTVKKKMLEDFADGCENTALHLSAKALPNQRYQVIIPMPDCKDNEIYAPNFHDGETVALIRYPHAGQFEIPILKVNNKLKQGREYLGDPSQNGKFDAVGINKRVADRLSGADFDGDTVMVIPCNDSRYSDIHIDSKKPLPGLIGFDPGQKYGDYPGSTFRKMKKGEIGKEMGMISNLINDMTLGGATEDQLAAAVRHSMVVIDAHKHRYDFKKSEADNHIAELKAEFQPKHIGLDGELHGGASTIISRAKNEERIQKRVGSPHIEGAWKGEELTGKKIWKDSAPEYYVDKHGKTQMRTQKEASMNLVDDARELVRGWKEGLPTNVKEMAYAEYANTMKAMARQARIASLQTPEPPQNKEAAAKYAVEVASLKAKYNRAMLNSPRERAAQRIATAEINAIKVDNPALKEDKEQYKKIKNRALKSARAVVGAARNPITITEKEWEAIEANAITKTLLSNILTYANDDQVKKYANPRATSKAATSAQSKIVRLARSHPSYTPAQLAEATGVSVSTVQNALIDAGL